MVYRKGEFQLSTLDRFYPFHVAIHTPYGRIHDYHEVMDVYRTLSDAPRQRSIGEHAVNHTIFGFNSEAAARTFQERFGGISLEPTHKARREAAEQLRREDPAGPHLLSEPGSAERS